MKMGKTGKWMAAAVFLLLLICQVLPIKVQAAKRNDTPVDFVLVLDQSGSMKSSDPERITVSAAKMFVDMLPSENARLAVIAFGDDYGSEAYSVDLGYGEDYNYETDSNYSKNRVQLAYGLNNITGRQDKNDAKAVINQVMEPFDEKDRYTPIGSALMAANQVLEAGNSERGSAAIILMSDGRVSGQGVSDKYNDGYDFHSIDMATAKAAEMDWPVYCLELNYDGINDNPNTPEKDPANSDGNVGYHQMREVIPGNTCTEPIVLNRVTQAQNAFADIFAEFFDAEPLTDSGTIEDGQVTLPFKIEEMTAETNLTVTGNISAVERIVLTTPSGKEEEYRKSGEEEGKRIISYDDDEKYITIKLIMPKEGDWDVTVYGTDGVEIGLYAVSIREMNLQLQADTTEEKLAKGMTVNFTASYIYNGQLCSGSAIYQKTDAYLVLEETGERIPMTGSENNYTAAYTFDKSGTYTVAAVVESELFRNEEKKSGSYQYTVGNLVTEPTGTMEDLEINVGGDAGPIDLSVYFTNRDNDVLIYSLKDPREDFTYDLTEAGVLTIHAGKLAGTYKVTIGATDGQMETEALQSFELKITNQPMVLADGLQDEAEVTLEFAYNGDSLPSFLLDMAGITAENGAEILWGDYFTDPDGYPAVITVDALEESDVITTDWDETGLRASGMGSGKSIYTVTGEDVSDSDVRHEIRLCVKSLDAKQLLWKKVKIPVMIASAVALIILGILLYAFAGRKIYGTWKVSSGSRPPRNNLVPAKTAAGGKAKCNLGTLLTNADIPNNFSRVKLLAGNRFSRAVYLTGLEQLDGLTIGAAKYDKTRLKKTKKLKINLRQPVTLIKDTIIVRLERIK